MLLYFYRLLPHPYFPTSLAKQEKERILTISGRSVAMTKKPGSGEMLHYLGPSPYKNTDARSGSINAAKLPELRHIETTTHKIQTKFVPRTREPSGISVQVPGIDRNGVDGVAQPQRVVPDGNVRGRDKAHKGGRASSSGSSSSSKEREKRELAEAAKEECLKALKQFRLNGSVRGLAQHARDKGIPEDLRRVCTEETLLKIGLLG